MPILLLLFGLFCVWFLGCTTSQQTSSNNSDYHTTNQKYPTLIQTTTSGQDWCKAQYAPAFRILQLQGKQLYDCLKFQPKALVYTWRLQEKDGPYPTIDSIQKHCDLNGIRLYVVADSYQYSLLKKEYALDYPIISINTAYYKSAVPIVYHKKFLQDLGVILQSGATGQLHYFQYGHYRGTYKLLTTI